MQAFSEIFFNEFMADKFGFLVKNYILIQYITEPFSRCEQFQQFGTRSSMQYRVFPVCIAAGSPFRHSVPLNLLIFSTL